MLALFAAAMGVGPLVASASPASTYGKGGGVAPELVVTNASNVSVSGGSPPYSYSWSREFGSTSINPINASAASTAFSRADLGVGVSESADFICTVTDALGRTAVTNSVIATVENI